MKSFIKTRATLAITALAIVTFTMLTAPAMNAQSRASRTTTATVTSATTVTPMYINFNTHNEEDDYRYGVGASSSSRSHSAATSYEDSATFVTIRAFVKQLADTIARKNAKWDWQSDWRFLSGTLKYDRGDASTNSKTIVKWLAEDKSGNVEVDVHSHETTYNNADVAHLFDSLGVTVSPVVGGFTYNAAQGTNGGTNAGYTWDSLARGLQGRSFRWTMWTPQILWGGASGTGTSTSHGGELSTYGVWKPKSLDSLFYNDASKTLTIMGNGVPNIVDSTSSVDSTVHNIVVVLDSIQRGLIPAGKFYTCSIDIHQKYFASSGYIAKVAQVIDRLQSYVTSGRIIWATNLEKVAAWQSTYSSQPNFYPYTQGTVSVVITSTTTSATTRSTTSTVPTPSTTATTRSTTSTIPTTSATTAPTRTTAPTTATIDMRVYPNPASSVVTVELTGSITTGRLRIVSAFGTEIVNQDIAGAATIDVSRLSNGMYAVEITSGSAVNRMQLIVNH